MRSITLNNFKHTNINNFIQKPDKSTIKNTPSFKQKEDNIELSTKVPEENPVKKKNTGKIIAGLSIAIAAAGIGIYLFKNRKMPAAPANTQNGQRAGKMAEKDADKAKEAAKQGIDKIAEHIDFKKAKSVDEAVQYGINNLGIKEYVGFCDKKQDLEILNWINEGITNVSNRAKGKINIPKCIYLGEDMSEAAFACGCGCTTTVEGRIVDSMLGINKKQVDNLGGFLVDLKNNIARLNIAQKGADGKFALADCFVETKQSRKFLEYMEAIEDGKLKTFEQKINAYSSLLEYQEVLERALRAPYVTIKNAPALKNNSAVQNGIEALKNSSLKAQSDYIMDEVIYNPAVNFKLESQPVSRFKSIYHEMGHINDKLQQQRPGTTIIHNNNYDNYPKELKEWVDNAENMQLANYVSLYSADGPEEFVAEIFAKTLNGAKFPKAVMDLYNKLNGPKLL